MIDGTLLMTEQPRRRTAKEEAKEAQKRRESDARRAYFAPIAHAAMCRGFRKREERKKLARKLARRLAQPPQRFQPIPVAAFAEAGDDVKVRRVPPIEAGDAVRVIT